jgi:hypothetical protein
MIYNGDHPEVRNTGHMDWAQGVDGRWWAVFLGVRPQGKDRDYLSQLGRETFLAPMEWVDGWPVVNNKQRIGLTCEVEGEPLPLVEELKSWRDDFELKGEWRRLDVHIQGVTAPKLPASSQNSPSAGTFPALLSSANTASQTDREVSHCTADRIVSTWTNPRR